MPDEFATQALIDKARTGDGPAFDTLVGRYRDRVRENVEFLLRTEPGIPADMDEIFQETFVRAFRSLDRFEWQGEDSFYLWLCGITRKVILMQRKKARRSRRLAAPGRLAGSAASPSRAMRREERFDRLEAALAHLGPVYREVLRLSRLEGMRVKEIAQHLNKTENSVSHLLARGTMELKRRFGETESLHLPERRLRVEERAEGESDGND